MPYQACNDAYGIRRRDYGHIARHIFRAPGVNNLSTSQGQKARVDRSCGGERNTHCAIDFGE